MKKLFLILIILFLGVGIIYSQSITVTNPHSGQTWHKGSAYNITWTKSGAQNANVKIRLYNPAGTTLILPITDNTANSGSFHWTIPNSVASGNYVVRVKTVDNAVFDDSDVFLIKNREFYNNINKNIKNLKKEKNEYLKNLKRTIRIIKPNKDTAWLGDFLPIKWDKNFGNYNNVSIYLCFSNDNIAKTIITNCPNDGYYYGWYDTKNIWPSEYYIKITTSDNKISGKSRLFRFKKKPPKPPKKNKVIMRLPIINNQQQSEIVNNGVNECLFANLPSPGRNANDNELKTGHFYKDGKSGKCSWEMRYKFFSELQFDLVKVKGKKIVRAELLISLSEKNTLYSSPGVTASTESCNDNSRIFMNGKLIKTFYITIEGEKLKINLLDSVKEWALSGLTQPYAITIKGCLDSISFKTSTCLRYYYIGGFFVEYEE